MSEKPEVDYQAVTALQQEVWASGDFHEIARQNVVMAEALCAAVDPHGGERVLDIACGRGTAALVAARRYCFRSDLHEVFRRYNRATDGTAVVENRYLLTVATRA